MPMYWIENRYLQVKHTDRIQVSYRKVAGSAVGKIDDFIVVKNYYFLLFHRIDERYLWLHVQDEPPRYSFEDQLVSTLGV